MVEILLRHSGPILSHNSSVSGHSELLEVSDKIGLIFCTCGCRISISWFVQSHFQNAESTNRVRSFPCHQMGYEYGPIFIVVDQSGTSCSKSTHF